MYVTVYDQHPNPYAILDMILTGLIDVDTPNARMVIRDEDYHSRNPSLAMLFS